MRRIIFALLVTSLAVLSGAVAEAKEPTPLSTFMRVKLEHSKKLLEAITTEDYEMMAKESQKLTLLTLAEQWEVLQTPEYEQHSREFRRTASTITEAAEKKNLDGAALAYVELTMKCVNCHKYIKKHRTAGTGFDAFERYVGRP